MDLLEYKASFIWNLVTFGNVMFALLEPSTKFVVLNMVLTLAFINVNSRKYLLSQRIVCGCTVCETYIIPIHLETK